MAYSVAFLPAAEKQLAKLDKPAQRRILTFLETKAARAPRDYGAALVGAESGFWKYRIGDYRAVCDIQDGRLTVLVVKIGHRREVYRRP